MRRAPRRLRWTLAAALVAVLAWAPALSARAAPPVWRIRGPAGGEVVLFGSVHLLNPGQDWRTPELAADLAKAQSVWFEAPFDANARARTQRLVAERSRLPRGATLSARLSPVGRARLSRVGAQLGLPVATLESMQPWFADNTLTVMHLQARGARLADGVEEAISDMAPAGARRRAFETPEEQVALLAGATPAEQAASLEETLRQIEEQPAAFDRLQTAWIGGDLQAIVRGGLDPLRRVTPGVYRRLVVERNRRWASRIERLLKTPERAFIVVGVGHLVGPESVPALLRRRGVQVDGP